MGQRKGHERGEEEEVLHGLVLGAVAVGALRCGVVVEVGAHRVKVAEGGLVSGVHF